jgi:hypothetical protein
LSAIFLIDRRIAMRARRVGTPITTLNGMTRDYQED